MKKIYKHCGTEIEKETGNELKKEYPYRRTESWYGLIRTQRLRGIR